MLATQAKPRKTEPMLLFLVPASSLIDSIKQPPARD